MNDKILLKTDNELQDRAKDLIEIKSIFDKLNLRFYLIDGVLLGAVREKGFIKWDWDVELAIFEEEIMPNTTNLLNALFDSGFEILSVNPFSSFFKINIKKRDTKFSLMGLKLSRKKWRYRSHVRYPAPLFNNATSMNFLGNDYLAPYPPEAMLSFCYGDWKKPLRSANNSEYIKNFMPKFLTLLIKIRHIFAEFGSYSLYLKMGIMSKILPQRREYLFNNIMLRKALTKGCSFIEIGSSDGLEMSNAIKFTKGLIDGYIIEPSVENLECAKTKIQKKIKKYGGKISFTNQVISGVSANVDYYYSPKKSNLSGIIEIPEDSEKKQIKSTTVKDFLLENNISLSQHIVIKMDVEGAEVEILQSSFEIFSQMTNVSILMEVHPRTYKGDAMQRILKTLFASGFKATLVESAWVQTPELFKDAKLSPTFIHNNRALYKDVDNSLVIAASSYEILNVAKIKPFFTKKIIRSILIEKREKKLI